MLKRILIALALAVAAFCVFVATRPSQFQVVRQARMDAPAEIVYSHVVDFRRWRAWMPWDDLDPNQQRRYEGAPSGVGAIYHWSGNDDVGEGRMTIEEAVPGRSVRIRLEFIRPFATVNTTVLAFEPQDGGTRATWTMIGNNGFLGKAFALFVDMDAMLGADFEKGLARLSAVSAADARLRDAQP